MLLKIELVYFNVPMIGYRMFGCNGAICTVALCYVALMELNPEIIILNGLHSHCVYILARIKDLILRSSLKRSASVRHSVYLNAYSMINNTVRVL